MTHPNSATLRPIRQHDFDTIIELNETALEGVGSLDHEGLALLVKQADQALVCEEAGDIAGFVITLPPGSVYDSSRYDWFEKRLDEYVYLDRIVVSRAHRRKGVASRLYDAVEADVPVALEVYDTNEPSLAFHERRGYRQVGALEHAGKTNLMMLKAA